MRPDLRPARVLRAQASFVVASFAGASFAGALLAGASRTRASRTRALRAATALAWLLALAWRPVPAGAQAPPRAEAQAADPVAPAVPDARPGEVAVQLAATGTLAASLSHHAPADDAHLCATLALAGGRQDYLLRYGADPAASVLDPARPALVLTVAGLDDAAPSGLSPRNGSVQVAIGGQTFFGSTQPGAPFRLELSVLEDQEGGRFVARHLTDRSGRQVIDLAGAWRCGASPTAVAALAAPRATGAAPDRPAPARDGADTLAAADNDAQPAAPAPGAADAPGAPGLPPATAFRQLLTQLDHAAPPDRAVPAPAAPDAPRVAVPPEPARAGLQGGLRAGLQERAPRIVPPLPGVAVPSPEFSSRRVFIHYRAGSRRGSTVADDLARTLDPQFARTEIRTVRETPTTAEIRYSHPDDAAAASALARRLGGANSPWHVRGFTNLSRRTTPGSLEVWIPER